MKSKTYWANIYLGLRVEYTDKQHTYAKAEKFIKKYVTDNPMCVTMTRTNFAYVDGDERGLIIGIINYPRFPKSQRKLKEYAMEFAKVLKEEFAQKRISIMFPDTTLTFS